MNRLHQLQQTLLQNIADNEMYERLEFVLLDYNSQDGLEAWVAEHLAPYIQSGRLSYYRTPEPQVFDHSHSKNMAFSLAKGDIVCNINADHYTGKNFAAYVNDLFTKDEQIVLTTIDYNRTQHNYHPAKDVFGKVCVRKEDFLKVRGFDESMKGYGFEDYDFVNRLELTGLTRVFIQDNSFLQFISHKETERYSLEACNVKDIYIHYHTPSCSDVIFLFTDHSFAHGGIIDNAAWHASDNAYAWQPRPERFEYRVTEPGFITGEWQSGKEELLLKQKNGTQAVYHINKEIVRNKEKDKHYYRLTDAESIKGLLVFNYFFKNRAIMEKNLKCRNIQVNKTGYGQVNILSKPDSLKQYNTEYDQ